MMRIYYPFKQLFKTSFVILAFLIFSQSASADPHPRNTLTLTGIGTIEAEPDIAFISTGVVSQAKTPADSLDENNKKMSAIFKLLENEGVEAKDMQTNNFNIQPVYSHHKDQRAPKIIGYKTYNNLTVKITDLKTSGKILTALVKSGSNDIGNIRFDNSKKSELLNEARKKAVQDARKKAELYATEAGFKLGKILLFNEAGSSARPQFKALARSAALEAAADTPIAGGSSNLSARVTIQWEIEQ